MAPVLTDFKADRHVPRDGFVWSENKKEFASSGGVFIRALLFRAMQDSLVEDEALRDEAREWLRENFKSYWNLVFGKGVDRMYEFLLKLWSEDSCLSMAAARSAISYSMNQIAVVDPEGESRFDPLKYKRGN